MNHCPDVYINRPLKGKSVVLTGFEDVARSDCLHQSFEQNWKNNGFIAGF